jgi:hypothetical protein
VARTVFAVMVGYAVWTAVWLGGNAILFGSISAEVANGEHFNALGRSWASSRSASRVPLRRTGAAAIAKERASVAVLVTAVLLLLTGIGVQSTVWHLMPLWYHATFLVLIVPVCVLAGRLWRQPVGNAS